MNPVVGIVCSLEAFAVPGWGVLPHHAVYEQYVRGMLARLPISPILIPAVGGLLVGGGEAYASSCMRFLDGLVLPGGGSHVDPTLYGARRDVGGGDRDLDRDATVMPLIRGALAAGVPLMGICRGMQELNVALGGSLIPAVHEGEGRRGHRTKKDVPFRDRYDVAHPLRVSTGGWLDRTLAAAGVPTGTLHVNSLHSQAVERLGDGVVAEAWADDDTVEAIRVEGVPALAFGVQWHLEWHVETPLHAALIEAFGRAVHERARPRVAA